MTDKLKGAPKFSAETSCYVEINGYTVYIEVSGATDNVPLVNYWTEDYDDDTVTHMVVEQADD